MDIKDVTKEIRAILKRKFPATKFSVTTKRFSMGESVETSWTDGPTKPQVNDLIGKYGDTRFRFINTSRKHSIEFANKVIKVWKEQNPKYAHFTITSQGKVDCCGIEIDSDFNSNDIRQDCEDSIYKFLRNSTLDSLTLATFPGNTDREPEAISASEPELVEVLTEVAPQSQLSQLDAIKQPMVVDPTVDYVVAIYNSYSSPERKNDEPEYFTLDKWRETVGQDDQLTAEAYGCLTSYNMALERMTVTAICCNLPEAKIQKPSDLDSIELDTLEADRQQAYQQYLASQQEADAFKAKLTVKKTEAQVYFAIMKEIDQKIEAKKRETEVTAIAQIQPDFDVRTLEGKKVTLILINAMGFPICRHITLIAADIVSAKRYHGEMTDKKCLELQYIEKGKRKPKGTRYTEASLAVALGWQEIKIPNNNGYIDAFDNDLLEAMVRQAKDVVYTQQGL